MRVPLYDRLPEIYRLRDEQEPEREGKGQLRAYIRLVEYVLHHLDENIESLYQDLFIETCDDWVIPYIGDLLGTTHLSGDPWTLRADVADTIALRRRKGTIGAIELLAFDLTKWGAHCVELLENLVWHQHLNHQRPDEGGNPSYGLPPGTLPAEVARTPMSRHRPIRGGTITLRDPALLSLLGTPFDPFAHIPDCRPPAIGAIRYNLPNLAIFLWRLEDYRIGVSQPVFRVNHVIAAPNPGEAGRVLGFDVHPNGEPLRLFNTYQFDPDRRPPELSEIDEMPGQMPMARLTSDSAAGNPQAYLATATYDATLPSPAPPIGDAGLQLDFPQVPFAGTGWTFRGANLCAWEAGLDSPLRDREIAIDPVIGRVAIGVATAGEATAVRNNLLLAYTYGAVGPVGAHPISRPDLPDTWLNETFSTRTVRFDSAVNTLEQQLGGIQNSNQPIIIEIQDSMTYDLDLAAVAGILNESGNPNLRINRTLIIRSANGQRPVIRLAKPLRFRPTNVLGATPAQQELFNAVMDGLTVRLEGLYLTRGPAFPANQPLVARAALHSLELMGTTLDPGGFLRLDGTRAPIRTSVSLPANYGFANAAEETAFNQTPELHLVRAISGPLLMEPSYTLFVTESIVDAGAGVEDALPNAFCISGSLTPATGWGPPLQITGATFFGRVRAASASGRGGVFVHALEVQNNQKGCIKFSYFEGVADRIPQYHACVFGTEADLRFVAEIFGHPAYGQLAMRADFRIRERGPNDDAMGAFGFVLEAHKWRNLQIRFREFMPVGIRPLLIPVT